MTTSAHPHSVVAGIAVAQLEGVVAGVVLDVVVLRLISSGAAAV